MERLPMYEVKIQLIWDPQGLSHDNYKKTAQLSQVVEPRKNQIMMVDTNCECGINITRVNMSALWKMHPMVATKLGRD